MNIKPSWTFDVKEPFGFMSASPDAEHVAVWAGSKVIVLDQQGHVVAEYPAPKGPFCLPVWLTSTRLALETRRLVHLASIGDEPVPLPLDPQAEVLAVAPDSDPEFLVVAQLLHDPNGTRKELVRLELETGDLVEPIAELEIDKLWRAGPRLVGLSQREKCLYVWQSGQGQPVLAVPRVEGSDATCSEDAFWTLRENQVERISLFDGSVHSLEVPDAATPWLIRHPAPQALVLAGHTGIALYDERGLRVSDFLPGDKFVTGLERQGNGLTVLHHRDVAHYGGLFL